MTTGIDISNNNGTIDWSAVSGVDFVFAKATEGLTFDDPMFGSYRTGAERRGLRFGPYHFSRPSNQPGVSGAQQEAQHFLRVIRALLPGELPAVNDFEDVRVAPNVKLDDWLDAWLTSVGFATKRTPIIYTFWSYWLEHIQDPSRFARFPLWIAAYQSSAPKLTRPWMFWQHADNARVPGIASLVDADIFDGSQQDLDRLAGLGQFPITEEDLFMRTPLLHATPEGTLVTFKGLDGVTDVPLEWQHFRAVTANRKATTWAGGNTFTQGATDGTLVYADPASDVVVTYV